VVDARPVQLARATNHNLALRSDKYRINEHKLTAVPRAAYWQNQQCLGAPGDFLSLDLETRHTSRMLNSISGQCLIRFSTEPTVEG
jgi:hypothetical protein